MFKAKRRFMHHFRKWASGPPDLIGRLDSSVSSDCHSVKLPGKVRLESVVAVIVGRSVRYKSCVPSKLAGTVARQSFTKGLPGWTKSGLMAHVQVGLVHVA